MRPITSALLATTLLVAVLASGQPAANAASDQTVVDVRIDRGTSEIQGTAVTVRRQDLGEGVVLYFLTAAHLLRGENGAPLPSGAIHLLVDEGRTVAIEHQDVFVPIGSLVDIAVLRTTLAHTRLAATPIAYMTPSFDDGFVISGFDEEHEPTTAAQQVRFVSTLLAVGDRDVSGVPGCAGAPAISTAGVFGIVTQCDAHRPPVISLLLISRSFIERVIPAVAVSTSAPRHSR
jgi:hypothetical protein